MSDQLFYIDGNYKLQRTEDFPEVTEENALDLSIAKWEAIVQIIEEEQVKVREQGHSTCALCQLHRMDLNTTPFWDEYECGKCVVYSRVGEESCEGTPYNEFTDADTPQEQLVAAIKQVEFLKSLKE